MVLDASGAEVEVARCLTAAEAFPCRIRSREAVREAALRAASARRAAGARAAGVASAGGGWLLQRPAADASWCAACRRMKAVRVRLLGAPAWSACLERRRALLLLPCAGAAGPAAPPQAAAAAGAHRRTRKPCAAGAKGGLLLPGEKAELKRAKRQVRCAAALV